MHKFIEGKLNPEIANFTTYTNCVWTDGKGCVEAFNTHYFRCHVLGPIDTAIYANMGLLAVLLAKHVPGLSNEFILHVGMAHDYNWEELEQFWPEDFEVADDWLKRVIEEEIAL